MGCALKNTYLNPQKNVEIIKTVIPELNTFHSMLHIRDIDDRKATDEEEEELKLDLPEPKINKKGKKIEHDPELVEEARIRALFKRELERYGRTWVWESYFKDDDDRTTKWLAGAAGLRRIND